jgi:hypothetical protein
MMGLNGNRNLRIVILVLLSAIPITLVYFLTRPDQGLVELKRSRDAIAHARSWRVHEVIKSTGDSIFRDETKDVSCPTEFDVETFYPQGRRLISNVTAFHQSRIHAGTVLYTRNDDEPWISTVDGAYFASPDCSHGPVIRNSVLFSDIDMLTLNGEVKRGERKLVADGYCRLWQIASPRGSAGYTACINENDHLPRQFTYDAGRAIYDFSNWNLPTVILAPR